MSGACEFCGRLTNNIIHRHVICSKCKRLMKKIIGIMNRASSVGKPKGKGIRLLY